MSVKLLSEHHLEFLSLKGRCRGSSESTLVKMSNCWKSHATTHLSLSYCLVSFLQPCGHLLESACPLGSLVCDISLCFCHFPIWCLESGVVLYCIDS